MKVCILDLCCDTSRSYINSIYYVNKFKISPIEEADIICYVGCAYNKEKIDKVYKHIESIISVKKDDAKVSIFGCVTKYDEFYNIVKEAYDIDYIGRGEGLKMQEELINYLNSKIDQNYFVPELGFSFRTRKRLDLVVQDGCNNRCSFCKSNYLNLRNRSVPMNALFEDFDFFIDKYGITEFNITGLNPSQYGVDLYGSSKLADLVKRLGENSKVKNILLDMLSIPDMNEELLSQILTNPKIKRVMLPVQSFDNRLLNLMRRKHNAEEAEKILTLISKERPDIFLETIFMAHYPTEDISNIQKTINFLEKGIVNNPVLSFYNYGKNVKTLYSENIKEVSEEEQNNLTMYYYKHVIPIIDQQRKELLSKPVFGTLVEKGEKEDYFSTLYRFTTQEYSVVCPKNDDALLFEDYNLAVDFLPSLDDVLYEIEKRPGKGKIIQKI